MTPPGLVSARGRSLSEKHFSQQVVDLARALGWRVYRTWLSIRSPAGFPDLVLVRQRPAPRLIFAELKTDTGKTTPEQDAWLEDLAAVAAASEVPLDMGGRRVALETHVWRPRDFDAIARILGAREDAKGRRDEALS